MLLEHQLKSYIKASFLPTVLRQVPANYDPQHGLLTLNIKIDLAKTLRTAREIGAFIVGNFSEFSKLVENCIVEDIAEHKKLKMPVCGVNLTFVISNCVLPRHNIESMEFLSAMFQKSQGGTLIFIKDCRIMAMGQPQMYLSSWVQLWESGCKCEAKIEQVRKTQRLIDIVRYKAQNLQDVIVEEPLRCKLCNSKLKLLKIQEQIYTNCQKIKVLAVMGPRHSVLDSVHDSHKEQIFNKGQLQLYLDQGHTSLLHQGDTIDICAYFSAEPYISKIVGRQILVKTRRSAMMISFYQAATKTSLNNTFFSTISRLNCEYVTSAEPRDQKNVSLNFNNFLQTINTIKFPYLGPNTLSTLKMVIINSLFNMLHMEPLHLMVVTEEVSFIEKAIRLKGVLIRKWPSLYDHSSLLHFLAQCHNAVIIITNPSKKDYEYINNLLYQSIMKSVNFTLWILCQPDNQYRKQLQLDKIDIIIDVSVQKNAKVCSDAFDDLLNQRLEGFINSKTREGEDMLKTATRTGNRMQLMSSRREEVPEQPDTYDMREEAKIAKELLQHYFLRAREYKHITSSSLSTIKKVASGFAYFRSFLTEKGSILQSSKIFPNVLDSILSIFLQQQTSRNKYGPSNTLFGNEISKLMLNEEDCQMSFWNYDVEDDMDILGQTKRIVTRDMMFRKMVEKLMALVYGNELI